ncbi:MAG: hypothetical protein HYY93_01485 [Planctomycetes bacterium]|nr:hypothetical protein [Planctomycetota bacterium]
MPDADRRAVDLEGPEPRSPADHRGQTIAAFLLGIVAQVAQVFLLRDFLTVFSGNELVLGLVFAAWMLAFAAGAGLASRGAGRDARPTVGAGGDGRPTVGGSARPIFGLAPGTPFTLAATAVMAAIGVGLPALNLGIAYGALVRGADRDLASRVFVGESAGSVLGGMAMTFVLLTALPPVTLLLAATIGLEALILRQAARWSVAGATDAESPRRVHRAAAAGLLLAAVGAAGATWHLRSAAALFWSGQLPGHAVVRSAASPYGEIAVLTRHEQYDVFQSGHLLFSLPDRGESAPISTLFLLQHPAPKSVCLLGGSVSGPLKVVLAFPGVTHVDAVELDPRVLRIVRDGAGPDDQAALLDLRATLHEGDGRRFLQRDGPRYDLILCLLPEPDTIQGNRFYTSEFFRAARARLSEGGVLAIGPLASSGTYVSEELLARNAAIWRTLRAGFREAVATPGTHLFLIASDRPGRITLDEDRLLERLQSSGVRLVDIFPYCERFYVEKVNRELAEESGSTVADGNARATLNADDRPLGAYQSLRVWARSVGGGAEALGWIEDRIAWWPALPGAVILVLMIRGLGRARRDSGAAGDAAAAALVFVGGFAGMALELVIFLRFQTAYGAVYGAVGALVALFLGGIAIGGWLGARTTAAAGGGARATVTGEDARATVGQASPPAPAGSRGLIMTGLALGAWSLALPQALGPWSASLGDAALLALFGGVMLLTGALVGAIYPAALSVARASPPVPAGGASSPAPASGASSAGALYALDLAGGALGALLAGTVLIPLTGAGTLCVQMAALTGGATVVAALVSGRGSRP